jgi:protein SCO1/2
MTLPALSFPVFAHDEQAVENRPNAAVVASAVTIEQRLNAQVPLDLVFTDETGRQLSLARYLDGKPALLAFVYYECPQLCPLVLDGLSRSLRPLDLRPARDYRVIAVSIDPRETAELAGIKKRAVMEHWRPEAATGWHFLTGDQRAIASLTESAGFRYLENGSDKKDRYVHAIGALALTPEGKISRYFYGIDYPPRDLRLALIEASGNRIGSLVDQLLLLCYKYDPTQGKYTVSVLNVLRLSAAGTVFLLGGFLVVMIRRERHPGRERTRPDGGTRS